MLRRERTIADWRQLCDEYREWFYRLDWIVRSIDELDDGECSRILDWLDRERRRFDRLRKRILHDYDRRLRAGGDVVRKRG